ncbi:glycosyltransferase family 39 protein [Candidatus Poribacteria bacterium]|nr:glycosyltransferase family 39 protein [Candidatus Poribacteria bacterium]
MNNNKNKYINYLYILIALYTIFRFFLSYYLNLGDDEAYYWEWTRHLALGYYDHPPLIGYILYIFTSLFGNNEIAVRLGNIILFSLTTYFIFLLSMEMFNDTKSAFYSALLLNITPVFAAGAFMAFPDTPLGFLWVATLYIIHKIILTKKTWLWYLAGVLVGLGLLCKYTAVLLPISILFFMITSKDFRFWLKRKEPYLASLLGLIVFSPVIIWNIKNHWASFGFQLTHGVGDKTRSFSFTNMGFLFGSQALYISPFLFFLSLFAIYIIWKKGFKENNNNYLLLSCFAIPTMLLFDIAGLFKRTMPHWTALGFISMFIALPELAKDYSKTYKNKLKIFSILTIIFAIIITGAVTIQTLYPILPLKPKYDVTNDLYGWPQAVKKAIGIKKEMTKINSQVFWLTHFHLVACQLAFYLPLHETVYNFSNRISQYNFWFDTTHVNKLIGKNAVYINTSHYDDKPEDFFVFDSMHIEEPVNIFRSGKLARSFNIYRIYNFKGIRF